MITTGTKSAPLASTVQWVTSEAFARSCVAPMLRTHGREEPAPACVPAIVQDTGTGRVTVQYDFGSGITAYGKLYTDGLAAHSFRVLRQLWQDGFGPAAPYRVPEPLVFLRDLNFVLLRGVPGTPLAALLADGTPEELVAGSREAARWLATLHRSALQVGDQDADWDSLKLFRIAVRLIKAAAAAPDHATELLELLYRLKEAVRRIPARRLVVQTHGRYHHDHIYVGASAVAVIDLDRSRPSDPAKDVAEFVRVMRLTAYKTGRLPHAEAATAAFLDEYWARVPDAAIGFPQHWAAFVLLSLFGLVKRLRSAGRAEGGLVEFHLREFDRALETVG